MATIDYKQKIKDYMNSSEVDTLYKSMLNNLFPELKESGDEKIRESLLKYLHTLPNHYAHSGVCAPEWIAWIERQGESIKIKKSKNYLCTKTHKYAGVEWIEGTKYYASDNYTLVNQGCECYCPEYSKEEHNNLFEEVKCDGYVEKQGEQKPDKWSERKGMNIVEEDMTPFQKEVFCIIDTAIEEEQGLKQVCDKLFALASNEIKKKNAWSEEDSPYYDDICEILINLLHSETANVNKGAIQKDLDWLKSIKDRVGCETNCTTTKEWSEEDDSRIGNLCYFLEEYGTQYYGYLTLQDTISWLKSLRPQSQWKPSDEQMEALWNVYQGGKEQAELATLYTDLKKLRNE